MQKMIEYIFEDEDITMGIRYYDLFMHPTSRQLYYQDPFWVGEFVRFNDFGFECILGKFLRVLSNYRKKWIEEGEGRKRDLIFFTVGTYEAKGIYAIAICHPRDTYNATLGREIVTGRIRRMAGNLAYPDINNKWHKLPYNEYNLPDFIYLNDDYESYKVTYGDILNQSEDE